jgi:hypothetical protein
MRKPHVIYWGTVFVETDIGWTWAKVRPWPYWLWRRLHLFVGIVWRLPDSAATSRIDWRTAWDISKCAVGLGACQVRPLPVVREAAERAARRLNERSK